MYIRLISVEFGNDAQNVQEQVDYVHVNHNTCNDVVFFWMNMHDHVNIKDQIDREERFKWVEISTMTNILKDLPAPQIDMKKLNAEDMKMI